MLHYVCLGVDDLQRAGAFYDALLGPLGWRRFEDGESAISYGLVKAAFYISTDDPPRPGFGVVSFPTKSIPAVKASYASGLEKGGGSVAEPGSAPLHGGSNYCARLTDPDGYTLEINVVTD